MIIKLGTVSPVGVVGESVTIISAPDYWTWDEIFTAVEAHWPYHSAGGAGEVVPPAWVWTDEPEFTPYLAARYSCPTVTEAEAEAIQDMVAVLQGRARG